MSIKTPEEYKEYIKSIKDNRVVYCKGERVKDVTTHCQNYMPSSGAMFSWVLRESSAVPLLAKTRNGLLCGIEESCN